MSKLSDILKPKDEKEIQQYLENKSPSQILQIGMAKNLPDIVDYAIENGALLDFNANQVMDWALKSANYKIVKRVAGELPKDALRDFLSRAIVIGSVQLVKIIMEKGVVPSFNDFAHAIILSKEEVFKFLNNETNIDLSQENNILLSLALFVKNKENIQILVQDQNVRKKLLPVQLTSYEKIYNSLVRESLINK